MLPPRASVSLSLPSCSGVEITALAVPGSLQRDVARFRRCPLALPSPRSAAGGGGPQGQTDLEGGAPGPRGLSFPRPGSPALSSLPGPSKLFDGIRANLFQMC